MFDWYSEDYAVFYLYTLFNFCNISYYVLNKPSLLYLNKL